MNSTAMNSYCSASLPSFDVVCVPDFGHSSRHIVVYNHFNLHFLMTYDVKHIFIYLFVICKSSLMRCLLRSLAHFLIKLFIFWLLSFKSSLYILSNSPLSNVSFVNIFSQTVAFLLTLLTLSFKEQLFYLFIYLFILVLVKSNISYSFHELYLWCYIYNE